MVTLPRPTLERNRVSAAPVRLLDAAKRVFAAKGFDAASNKAIAKLAGTTESQLIKYFGGKEGLLEAVFDEGWVRIARDYSVIQSLPSAPDKLYTLMDSMMSALDRDPVLRDLLLFDGRRLRDRGRVVLLTRGYMQLVETADGLLSEMRAAGQLRSDVHPQAVRSALMGMFEGLLRDRALAHRSGYPATYTREDMKKIFVMTLGTFMVPVRVPSGPLASSAAAPPKKSRSVPKEKSRPRSASRSHC